MHASADFLHSLAAVFCVAAVTTVICVRLRLPSVLALIAAGMLVGPFGPKFTIAAPDTVAALSELGIIFLMFTIGLELRVSKLAEIGLRGLSIALSGVSFTLLLIYGAALVMGFSPMAALFLAASLAISSTMMVTRVLAPNTANAGLRKTILGVLVIEDVLAMLLLTSLALVGKSAALDGTELLLTLGRLLGFLTVLVMLAAVVVPRTVRAVAKRERNEVLIVVVMGACFAGVLAAQTFGYPVALGALVAGSLCAESGESERIEDLTLPLKDVFSSVFFVSAGMAIDPSTLLPLLPLIATLVVLVVVGKSVGVALGFFFTGHSIRTSVQGGMNLGQCGEFGLVIAVLGASLSIGQGTLYPIAACVAAITMVLTPWLARSANPIAAYVDARLPRRMQNFAALYGSWVERLGQRRSAPARTKSLIKRVLIDALLLLIVGLLAALFSDDLARLLKANTELARNSARWLGFGIFLTLLLPIGLGLWRSIHALGNELATRALPKAKLEDVDLAQAPRKAFVLALQLAIWLIVSVLILAMLQPVWPNMPLFPLIFLLFVSAAFGFWRSTGELYSHTRAGTFAVLEAFKQLTQAQLEQTKSAGVQEIKAMLPGLGEFQGLRLEAGHPWVGRTLAELNLRGLSGANVLAIARSEGDVASPDGKAQIMPGDTLLLSGTSESIDVAAALHFDAATKR
jgi:monovalent cation:H+ antiporter-2, CPA2 family